MITKAIVRSINGPANRCVVRMPLFETADSSAPVEAEALVSIPPGIFNNLFVGDVVFVGFEENALEKPIILGKLFKGSSYENNTPGGMGVLDTLLVRTKSTSPAAETHFVYPEAQQKTYQHLDNAKEIADYILWLENLTKTLIKQLDGHFRCFKNWTQWQLKPANVEIDDGDLDSKNYKYVDPLLYQAEGGECKICSRCSRTTKNTRSYDKMKTETTYPGSA